MSVYQCLQCVNIDGFHPKIHDLTTFPDHYQRYLDCTIWNCPHCSAHLDNRNIITFLGLIGRDNLRELTDEELQEVIDFHT